MAVSFAGGVGRAGWRRAGAGAAAGGAVQVKFSVPRGVAYGQEVLPPPLPATPLL